FDRERLQRLEADLAATYPDRSALRDLYRAVRAAAGPGGRLPEAGDLEEAVVASAAGGRIDPRGLPFALAVFVDLGLVEAGRDGALALRERPGNVDLAQSIHYNEGTSRREAFRRHAWGLLEI